MQNSLENFLDAADGAGKVLAHARLLIKLARIYKDIAPTHLSQSSNLANYKSGIVVIHALSGAIAAKLNQLAPTLADGFSKRGIECNGVQVKVQARKISPQLTPSTKKPLSSKTSIQLEGLRDSLPASSLRAALENLLAHAAKEQ